MQLTSFSDYCLRVLIFAGTKHPALSSVKEIAAAYGINEPHVVKAVHFLSKAGYLETVRGRGGGLRLKKDPKEITVGDVVRASENNLAVVECLGAGGMCTITPACNMKPMFKEALEAFFQVLDRYTLSEILGPEQQLKALLNIG
ncbi:Rrf2 family transcriptional regulator [Kordiimonas sp. SCSIO 12610]|uniref:RrF2 family transcriptional regulator n=1 Tax=Kordiimonas sp. SCSIO 12610 TaxID=2829597 RepID=UPI00210D292E|nr:Rrf2 family transcriptional regulator [Kordiimonas sp. SCSIO 12610]UTW56079.1 Rrf2 family transcriptional regulator [Kordiimonas sp. SCSIO 12610]